MKKNKYKFNAIIVFALAVLGIFAGEVSAKDINGYYSSNDGGAFFIRQIGDKIYWFGEDPNGGYANVLSGTVSGGKITAKWWDVPKGKTKGAGEMVLEIKGDGESIVQVSSTSPFGAKTFKKMVPHVELVNGIPVPKGYVPEIRSRPEGFTGGAQNLTGAWQGDDGATYYVREMPTGEIVWVAENNFWGGEGGDAQPLFTHVFIGRKINGLIAGDWVDVPKGKSSGNGSLSLKYTGAQDLSVNGERVGFYATKLWRSLPNNLRGYADLHAHPMVNLGFGGKLVHGGTDTGSLLPADADCNHNVRAKGILQALGDDKSTHGGFGLDNPCGDSLRAQFIDIFQSQNHALETPDHSLGFPTFSGYPKWNDISHQKMWVDWIRRSYAGGQRVMVALATHNSTLAAIASGPGDGPNDDAASADLQIKEIKSFVGRHSDFMEVAYSSADIRRIVAANKMAIVLGVEIDNIGNFNKSLIKPVPQVLISNEIKRLYGEGVRYIFPVHVLDNTFGHTAVYETLFNYSNKRESGSWWQLQCASQEDKINYKFNPIIGSDVPKEAKDLLGGLAKAVKVSLDVNAPQPPNCSSGHLNKYGLNDEGRLAIAEMMKLGMLVDVDHMSQIGVNQTLDLAAAIPGGYPLVSGHTSLRGGKESNENSRTADQLAKIAKLGGMFGLGSDGVLADQWALQYVTATKQMGSGFEGRVAFGTDLNGLVKGAAPRPGSEIYTEYFPKSHTGEKYWNYRKDGVAHYGMLPDFLRDIATTSNGSFVNAGIMKNAEMFAQMWEKAEKESKMVK